MSEKFGQGVNKDALIAKLSLKNMSLERRLRCLEKKEVALNGAIGELTSSVSNNYIHKASIASWVQSLFENGKIPLPKSFSKTKNLVKVVCSEENIHSQGYSGISVRAIVTSGSTSVGFYFKLFPIPDEDYSTVNQSEYPGFRLTYAKPLPVKKPAKPKPAKEKGPVAE